MTKPDATYDVYVMPVYDLFSCKEKQAEEDRGMYGWHAISTCPNCIRRFQGWTLYSPTLGGYQGYPKTRAQLLHRLRSMARDTWTAHAPTYGPNVRHGWRIRRGSPEYHAAGRIA